ncbi:arginase [Listeria floridensis FSL S10-1187]|uniref:Arginase n=1 Tax=Listeria floridensis FSL S10-1187 TaxID=1265817 RepID=A0ABN0RFA0_9LIST|nr:arginase family protein [Listeria floridensis]EUJ32026.1 arginase [Listeria floridensis FSL S10-1187]
MQTVGILGLPWVFGNERKGTGLGPFAIRYTGLVASLASYGAKIQDFHNMPFFTEFEEELFLTDGLKAITSKVYEASDVIGTMLDKTSTSLILAGDEWNSLAVFKAAQKNDPDSVYILLDANAHISLTELDCSLPPGRGLLRTIIGKGEARTVDLFADCIVKPSNLSVLGTRRVPQSDEACLEQLGICHFDMTEIDKVGFGKVTDQLLKWLYRKQRPIHLLIDVDAIDPAFAPGVDHISSGGLYYREMDYLMQNLALGAPLRSITVLGLNPLHDDANKSAKFISTILESYFVTFFHKSK